MKFNQEIWGQVLKKLEDAQNTWVVYTPSQIERGDVGLPDKGLRPWSVPRNTGRFLHDIVREMGAEQVLELGTSIGYSTLWMAAALAEKDGNIVTIEREPSKYTYAKEKAVACGLDKAITFHHGEILDVLQKSQEEKWDLVFFDAEKGQYHIYFPIILKQLSEKGICVFDNIDTHPQKFSKLFELFKTIPDLSYLHICNDNGLLLVARNHIKFPRIAFSD
ncbi:MAG: class I SAM-dependent methyltransferase [Candidatus Pacebacteria bacterium]|nr:class I SAM-dependent methyltransferase [Candidatus Paceibacterota bacterium]